MGKVKNVLLANGDSWTFGTEIAAPEFLVAPGETGYGLGKRFKKDCHCHMPYNDYYRIPRIWPSYLGNLLGISEVVNIARPGRSNDTIYDTTIGWILENYISKNKSTEDLLVVIGWSSPERKNIIINEMVDRKETTTWFTIWPLMTETTYYHSPLVKEFFKFYVLHQWAEQEYLKRYVEQNIQLQNFCELYKIDYYVFNAFYAQPALSPHQWTDISVIDQINKWTNLHAGQGDLVYNWEFIKKTLRHQWNMVSKRAFVNKDHPHGSFRSYIFDNVDVSVRMCNWHPSPESHEAWANYLFKYITNEDSDLL